VHQKFANFADLPSQIGLDLIDFEKQKIAKTSILSPLRLPFRHIGFAFE
jgi:hypothetical protein